MSNWQPIETAPKDGSRVLCCWVGGEPCFLVWKTNRRLLKPEYRELSAEEKAWLEQFSNPYFGDPNEDDDYDLARTGKGPTHWMPLPEPPEISRRKA